MRQVIETTPAPAGNYSPAVKVNNTLYLSGQLPLDPLTMALVPGDISAQARQVFLNTKQVLRAAGCDLSAIVKLKVYLVDIADLTVMNEVIAEFFQPPFPARTTIQVVALPKSASVEIEALAFIQD